MLFLLKVILIAALSYVTELVLPWWSVVASAFLIEALIPSRTVNSFLTGFLGVGLLWLIYAWIVDAAADSIISERMAQLFSLSQPALLIVFTALIGAVIGGLGALSGNQFRRIFERDKGSYR